MKNFIVITSINEISKGIKKFQLMKDWNIVIVGDKKSKPIKNDNNLKFLSVEDQEKLNFNIIKKCPYNHYTRKNIGYLFAIKEGANVIYETDDDNIPYNNWTFPSFKTNNILDSESNFINVYKYFTEEKIWPRGYPLDNIIEKKNIIIKNLKNTKTIGVWQGLADIEPDVDAIYRLTINKKIKFNKKEPIALPINIYCPFNSQNTLWNKETFEFMYLPSTVSFRYTDILRGYIAQKLIWMENLLLGFTKATVYQERNIHNFLNDFKSEIDCYIYTKNVTSILDNLKNKNNKYENISNIYKELTKNKIVKTEELDILQTWINDLKNINK